MIQIIYTCVKYAHHNESYQRTFTHNFSMRSTANPPTMVASATMMANVPRQFLMCTYSNDARIYVDCVSKIRSLQLSTNGKSTPRQSMLDVNVCLIRTPTIDRGGLGTEAIRLKLTQDLKLTQEEQQAKNETDVNIPNLVCVIQGYGECLWLRFEVQSSM